MPWPSNFSNETMEYGVRKAELNNCSTFARTSSCEGSQLSFPGLQTAWPGDESANVMKLTIAADRPKVRIVPSPRCERADVRLTPESGGCSALAHVRSGPKTDIALSTFATRRHLAADAEIFGFSAEGCSPEPFGSKAAL